MTLTNERLDELAAMEQAATARPWFAVESDDDFFMTQHFVSSVCEGDEPDEIVAGTLIQNCKQVHSISKRWQENAAFIAAARNEFAAMIEQCKEANRLREAMLATYESPTVGGIFSIIEAALKGPTP